MSAITALTAQNTLGVQAIEPVSIGFVRQQIRSVLADIGADAIKIGMLHSVEVVVAVTEELAAYPEIPVVVDPVMVSTSGHQLLEEPAIEALRATLFPRAMLITPNLIEARLLAKTSPDEQPDLSTLARKLAAANGNRAVLVKGGHLTTDAYSRDVLLQNGLLTELVEPRVDTQNTHGTGCTLSAAIATYLGFGHSLAESCRLAKQFLTKALIAAKSDRIGYGHGPVHWVVLESA